MTRSLLDQVSPDRGEMLLLVSPTKALDLILEVPQHGVDPGNACLDRPALTDSKAANATPVGFGPVVASADHASLGGRGHQPAPSSASAGRAESHWQDTTSVRCHLVTLMREPIRPSQIADAAIGHLRLSIAGWV